jgi:hypothetical protein
MQQFCQRVSRGRAAATFEQTRQLVELLLDRVVVTWSRMTRLRSALSSRPRPLARRCAFVICVQTISITQDELASSPSLTFTQRLNALDPATGATRGV